MTTVNQLCSFVDCEEPRASGSHLCAKHRAELVRVDQIRKHHMTNGNGKPAAPTDDLLRCIEPGCNEPVLVTPTGRTFKRCKRHHGERIHAGHKPKAAAVQTESQPEPAEAPTPATNDEPVPPVQDGFGDLAQASHAALSASAALAQQVDQTAAELVPGALEQLIRQTLASHPDAVKLTVTGLKVSFSGEIEISS